MDLIETKQKYLPVIRVFIRIILIHINILLKYLTL